MLFTCDCLFVCCFVVLFVCFVCGVDFGNLDAGYCCLFDHCCFVCLVIVYGCGVFGIVFVVTVVCLNLIVLYVCCGCLDLFRITVLDFMV